MSWSKWHPFNRDTIKKLKSKLEDVPGVYSLRIATKNGNPKSLSRVSKKDENGTLYYGESTNLFRRLTESAGRCSGVASYPHSAGWTYAAYFSKTKWFENGLMQFRWKPCSNGKLARKEESDLLTKYRKKFMDNPPLNSSG
jgi:hypothetical protein